MIGQNRTSAGASFRSTRVFFGINAHLYDPLIDGLSAQRFDMSSTKKHVNVNHVPRMRRIEFRTHPGEKESFEKAADLSGLGLSAWVRDRLLNSSRKELADLGRKVHSRS